MHTQPNIANDVYISQTSISAVLLSQTRAVGQVFALKK